MKTLLAAWIALSVAFSLSAQEKEEKIDAKNVPDVVMKKFLAFYGDIKKVKWEKEGNNYQATFKQNKVKTSVTITADGNIIEKEWAIKKGAVPQAVLDSAARNFAGFKMEEFSKVEKSGLLSYEIELEGKKDGKEVEYKVYYSADGKMLSKIEETEEVKK
ncbi:MAG: PepSY-like domain-containing protein [Bacteroidota bacterium]